MGMARLGLDARGGDFGKQINGQKGRSTIEIALPPISAAGVGKAWDVCQSGCRSSGLIWKIAQRSPQLLEREFGGFAAPRDYVG
jgi:hypothetical protein